MPESPTRVLSKARAVLDCFLPDNRPMTLTEVANATGMPLTTTQRLLKSLVAEEFLAVSGQTYRLGLGLIGWASAARRGLSVVDVARLRMDALRDRTGETVTLLAREGLQRVCVAASPSRHTISARTEPGDLAPLQAGAPSKVLLAWDPATTRAVIERGLTELASQTVTDPVAFEADLAQVRERGWAISANENAEGVASVAAPIRDSSGQVIAALTLGGPSSRTTDDWLIAHAEDVVQTAEDVSQALGYRGAASSAPAAGAAPRN